MDVVTLVGLRLVYFHLDAMGVGPGVLADAGHLPENVHSRCGFATVVTDRRGRHQRHYRANDYRTPYEKLISLKKWAQYLKPGIPVDLLARQSKQRSDTGAALHMQKAKLELLARCRSMPR